MLGFNFKYQKSDYQMEYGCSGRKRNQSYLHTVSTQPIVVNCLISFEQKVEPFSRIDYKWLYLSWPHIISITGDNSKIMLVYRDSKGKDRSNIYHAKSICFAFFNFIPSNWSLSEFTWNKYITCWSKTLIFTYSLLTSFSLDF